jgi:gamma-glutamyltranspeptidase/glutathione hydrolase
MRRIVPVLLALLLTISTHAARQPVRARHGMVVAMESIAADVGISVLQKGGNAVDAAVAVGFAMAVTHPFAGNIGGGGYMLIRLADGRTTFIDFRERAPQKSSHDMYLDAKGNPTRDSIEGWRSSGVPGTVRGFEIAVTKYGKRTWAENMAPAVELATKGFPVSYPLAEGLKGSRSLASSPESKRIFQKNGSFFDIGETLTQPELAQTLARISKNGPSEFYEGETARRFAAEMASHGGIITLDDLKNYKAIERTPLSGTYHGYTIITSPPRVHHQWLPDKLSLERGISPDTVALLKSRGYDVDYAPGVVLAQVAAILSDGGWLQGASDGRSAAGKAVGY